jgi:hypothetical protein
VRNAHSRTGRQQHRLPTSSADAASLPRTHTQFAISGRTGAPIRSSARQVATRARQGDSDCPIGPCARSHRTAPDRVGRATRRTPPWWLPTSFVLGEATLSSSCRPRPITHPPAVPVSRRPPSSTLLPKNQIPHPGRTFLPFMYHQPLRLPYRGGRNAYLGTFFASCLGRIIIRRFPASVVSVSSRSYDPHIQPISPPDPLLPSDSPPQLPRSHCTIHIFILHDDDLSLSTRVRNLLTINARRKETPPIIPPPYCTYLFCPFLLQLLVLFSPGSSHIPLFSMPLIARCVHALYVLPE